MRVRYAGQDLDGTPMTKIYDYFGLEAGTRDFIGHAMALHQDDA
jgi:Rab GDP dissociation inhibitor